MDHQISQLLGYWMKITHRNICNYLDARLEQFGLTHAQLGVLMILWVKDGLTQKQIQQILGIQPASLTNLIKGLETKELVTRKTDETDTRMNRIFLTEKSRELEQSCMDTILAGEEAAKRGFSQEEVNLLLSWLKRINKNLLDI